MSEQLTYEQAYTESLAYHDRNDWTSYQKLSDRLDNSRRFLDIFDDEALINACITSDFYMSDEYSEYNRDDLAPFDYLLWDMPYLDPDRALQFGEKIFDKSKNDTDLTQNTATTIAIGSIGPLTRILKDRTIPLWLKGYSVNDDGLGGELDTSLIENVLSDELLEMSDEFRDRVVLPAGKYTTHHALLDFCTKDDWHDEIAKDYEATVKERGRIDQISPELKPVRDYVLYGTPVPAESLLTVLSPFGTGIRRALAVIVKDPEYQLALMDEHKTKYSVSERFSTIAKLLTSHQSE